MKKLLAALAMMSLWPLVLDAQDYTVLSTVPDIRQQWTLNLGGEFYFGDQNGSLWKTDGVNPAQLVTSITTDCATDIRVQGVAGGEVWFSVGRSLYATDGTTTRFVYTQTEFACGFPGLKFAGDYGFWRDSGFVRSFDGSGSPVEVHSAASSTAIRDFVIDGEYYFGTLNGELWKSGGTAATTELLGSHSFAAGSLTRLTNVGGTIYGLFRDSGGAPTLSWTLARLDSATQQFVVVETVPVETYNIGNTFLENVGGNLFIGLDTVDDFIARPGGGGVGGATSSIFISDGTQGGLVPLVAPETAFSSEFTKSGGLIYFLVFEEPGIISGTLHATDGTVAGTVELNTTSFSGVALSLPADGGIVVTTASIFRGIQVWVSDGTAAGTLRNSTLEREDWLSSNLYGEFAGFAMLGSNFSPNYSVASIPLSFAAPITDMVVAEDAPNSTVVGFVPQQPNWIYTSPNFVIAGGNVGNAFVVEAATGKITVNDDAAIDFETLNKYTLEIDVTFAETGTFAHTIQITIDVLDVTEIEVPEEIIIVVIEDVQDLLDGGNLSSGDANPVLNFLTQALKDIDKGKTDKAIQKLEDAIDRIQDLIDSGDLTAAEGQDLIDWLQAAIALL